LGEWMPFWSPWLLAVVVSLFGQSNVVVSTIVDFWISE
jgi:hypothetical protein